MFKYRVTDGTTSQIIKSKEGFLHDVDFSENLDNAILTLVGTMYNAYLKAAESKPSLSEGLEEVKLAFCPRNPDLQHLIDPNEMFNFLTMLDAQGYSFDNATNDFAISVKETLSSSKDFTIVDAMALYWAKLNPELLTKCPRFETDEKFKNLYEMAVARAVSKPLILEEIIERKDYDVKEAIKQNMNLTEKDEEVVDYVLAQWDSVRAQIIAEQKKKSQEKS